MAKTALGRGLGELLDGAGIAGRAVGPVAPPSMPVSVGVGSLLRGKLPSQPVVDTTAEEPSALPFAPRRVSWLKTSLLAADVLLCGLAALFVAGKPAPLTAGECALCVLAVGVAAWLGFQAFLLDGKPD